MTKKGSFGWPKKEVLDDQKRKFWVTKKGSSGWPKKEVLGYQKRKFWMTKKGSSEWEKKGALGDQKRKFWMTKKEVLDDQKRKFWETKNGSSGWPKRKFWVTKKGNSEWPKKEFCVQDLICIKAWVWRSKDRAGSLFRGALGNLGVRVPQTPSLPPNQPSNNPFTAIFYKILQFRRCYPLKSHH